MHYIMRKSYYVMRKMYYVVRNYYVMRRKTRSAVFCRIQRDQRRNKYCYTGMFPVGDTSSGTLMPYVCVCVCVSVCPPTYRYIAPRMI